MFPVGPNEAERLRALEELEILNRPRNARFDAICAEACQHFAVPIMKPRTFTRGDRAELTLFADRVATEIMLRQPALVGPLLAGASPVGPRD